MMSDGSTLLLTPCELPPNDIVGAGRTMISSLKRGNGEIGIQSCPSNNSDYPDALPCSKKLRRYASEDVVPSKVRWNTVIEEQLDQTPIPSNVILEAESEEPESSEGTKSETWYSKEEYKQMLLDQSLTVHIMRSLRSLAGEKVAIDYCDEIDSDYSRFDELIKKHQIDPQEYCERGLESYLSEERRNEVNASRKLHKLLVIGEYVRRGISGDSNPELIRNISLNQSKKSQVRAQKLGLVDQREARIIEKNKNAMDQKEDTQQHLPQEQNVKPIVEKKMDHLLTNNLPSPVFMSKNIVSKSIDPSWSIPGASIVHNQPNGPRDALDGIRDEVLKQQLLQLLMKQQHEQSRIAQSQFHFQQRNVNGIAIPDDSSILASLQMQELERLFHQNQQQQQIQIQRNLETQVQRLLLLQQQQRHYELVSAAILGHHHR